MLGGNKLSLNQSSSRLICFVKFKMLSQTQKVLRCLNSFYSMSSKNVFNFFIGNFICVRYQKVLCYLSLEFPALKWRLSSNLTGHNGIMFLYLKMAVKLTQCRRATGVFNTRTINIKIKNRLISKFCYFYNSNQVSKSIHQDLWAVYWNQSWYCTKILKQIILYSS